MPYSNFVSSLSVGYIKNSRALKQSKVVLKTPLQALSERAETLALLIDENVELEITI